MHQFSSGYTEELKVQLKRWEHQFLKQNGRSPIKEDIRAHPDIKNKYKQYAKLKHYQAKKPKLTRSPSKVSHLTPQKRVDAELGPTPQIYGKVLSLFEMNISPRANVVIAAPSPTKNEAVAETLIGTVQLEEAQSVKRQLTFSMTPTSSPVKSPSLGTTMPRLPSPDSSRDSGYYGPNSPVKFDNDLTLKLSKTPVRLKASQPITCGSPSPLLKKPAKSLSQLAKEHQEILHEMSAANQDGVVRNLGDILEQKAKDDNCSTVDNLNYAKKRRRNVIRPALQTIDEEIQPKRNIHEQLAKLKQKALNEFNGVESDTSSDDGDTKIVEKKPKSNRKRKYNTVTNNFRRLKLPTKNRNTKWRRR
ncbi:Sld2p Ecym_7404 [Eremothecium cymbalariae DBVPG|uniref:DNA replication regulator SLD2 n=1 Tax=Eremothecium cymbalariae (strain CBS 270.75 / DBVPG 7215 / KCTC 17166 / NRRL Y-17582) TaxID=931890 RepID=G8JWL5_ERECY|nr:hypothetical protein Ecym_7404 [Eremothecium cymbalariae DBVPG\